MPSLFERVDAVRQTQTEFAGKPFAFGSQDCAALVRFHLSLFGYAVPDLPNYRTLSGAVRAARGVGGLDGVLDGLLEPIAPLQMLVGDVAFFRSSDGMGALAIKAGRKFIGYHEESDTLANIEPVMIEKAWRA